MATPMEILLAGNRDKQTMDAFANGLRGRKDVAQLAMLSGDQTVGQFGGALYNDVDKQMSTRIAEKEKQAQRDLTQGYYDQMAGQSKLSQAMAARKQAELERHNRATEENQRLRLSAGVNAVDKETARNVRYLSNSLEKAQVPQITEGIQKIDSELAPYLEADKGLPGVGGVSNWMPGFTQDARFMKSVIARIRNTILKARSGGAVTPQEADRLYEEFSLGGFNTDEDFMKSWADFKDVFQKGVTNIYGGYSPDVVGAYLENIDAQQGMIPGAPDGPDTGTDWNTLPQGGGSSPPQKDSGVVDWGSL